MQGFQVRPVDRVLRGLETKNTQGGLLKTSGIHAKNFMIPFSVQGRLMLVKNVNLLTHNVFPMKQMLVSFLALAAIALSCNKDKFKTEPQVEVISISPKTVVQGNEIYVTAKFTDDEGDVDSVLISYQWFNGAAVIAVDTFRYTLERLGVPAGTRQAEIQMGLEYNTQNNPGLQPLAGVSRDTTASFSFILKDKAKHKSNVAESEKIRLKRP